MNWIEDTVAEFGKQAGIPGLALGPQGVLQLGYKNGGLLALEAVQRGNQVEVVVYLGRQLGFQAAGVLKAALERAHFSHADPLPIQVALRGTGPDTLLLALVRLPERLFTPQSLTQAVDTLTRWLDEVQLRASR